MLFDDAQSYTAFKSSCRVSQSVTSPTPEYSLVSSAKLSSLDADTSLPISEIIIKNRRAIVHNEICQLGSETTKYQYFQLS